MGHADYVYPGGVYVYDIRTLVAVLTERWFDVLAKEPLKTRFLATSVSDTTLRYLQRVITAFDTVPRLDYQRDLMTQVVDPNHPRGGYRRFKHAEYTALEVQLSPWQYTLTALIGIRLNALNITGVAKTHITTTGDRHRDIFISPYCVSTDTSRENLQYFLFMLESFTRMVRAVNAHCAFFYGYTISKDKDFTVSKMATDGERFYLFDFSDAIYHDEEIDVSDQRVNDVARELLQVYGLDIFSFDAKHYVTFDVLCFLHASRDYYVSADIKEHCSRETRRLANELRDPA